MPNVVVYAAALGERRTPTPLTGENKWQYLLSAISKWSKVSLMIFTIEQKKKSHTSPIRFFVQNNLSIKCMTFIMKCCNETTHKMNQHHPSLGVYSMKMTRQHFEFIADRIAPKLSWPSHIQYIADELAKTNPKFDTMKFINRAEKAWFDNNPIEEIDDDYPY